MFGYVCVGLTVKPGARLLGGKNNSEVIATLHRKEDSRTRALLRTKVLL